MASTNVLKRVIVASALLSVVGVVADLTGYAINPTIYILLAIVSIAAHTQILENKIGVLENSGNYSENSEDDTQG